MSDIDEVPVTKVFRDTVATPRAATHAQGEIKAIIKTAAIAERMRLIDQYPDNINFFRKAPGMLWITRMNSS